MKIRLNKAIAQMGICSRRKADELIAIGHVCVNGKVVRDMGTKVEEGVDKITIDNGYREIIEKTLKTARHVYIVLNKPVDYICSTASRQGETVIDLITPDNFYKTTTDEVKNKLKDVRLYPVGRLDKDSEGLVLLTNDGGLTNTLTHPRYEHTKVYELSIPKPLDQKTQKVLEAGMSIGRGEHVEGIDIKKTFNKGRQTIVTIVLREGKNRQIRKMFGILGYHVQSLRRVSMGKITLGTIPVGKWKFVKRSDIV
ncbi:MAG: rRNA pseudouridine synthase [Candidatus Magasanikbacteria bacterium]|jgi:23S rRNA pseudouridine2605 synthase|nr:rRNA pseudouridine synthase [Candidatus Magasanikbacteria bacterium]MBT4071938.1 rRNA pseudouridine synthase [Candidatus Magasanikbacteria bacterium]